MLKKFAYDVSVGALSLAIGALIVYGTRKAMTKFFPDSPAALIPPSRQSNG